MSGALGPHIAAGAIHDIRDFGARGDRRRPDTAAINAAIAAAAVAGGTVLVPPGRWLSFSIRLASRVTLLLADGAVLEAADPALHPGQYDLPEPSGPIRYQDFGHSHWHNSLIWGVGLHDVAIVGRGHIDGRGLTRDGPGARWQRDAGERPLSMAAMTAHEIAELEPEDAAMAGLGNKAIALKQCRGVTLEDFSIADGGHFAILATGVEDMRIARLAIDTQRDGIDLDSVRRVRVTGCRVNTPNDDAIVLKSSLALGEPVPTEDVIVENCIVSGFDAGTMFGGTYGRSQDLAPDRDRVTGRIKLGTESSGGFRNIIIRDCEFYRSRGLALETVDGGMLEEIEAARLVMREVTTAPIFLRLGDRRRGPPETGIGTLRGVRIAEVDATGIDHRFAATIAGLPGHGIEDVLLRDLRLRYRGGGSASGAARRAPILADAYPEPSMFGVTPAWGLWLRHAKGVALEHLALSCEAPDARPELLAEASDYSRI